MTLFNTDRVLVPVDFSEVSFEALNQALASVGDPTHLHVLHVLSELSAGEPGVTWSTVDNATRKQEVMKHLEQRFSGDAYSGIHIDVSIGNPSSEIIDYATTHQIDLIVIPSHGRTGISRFLIGSVAERVVRLAPCPVLVLRRND